MHLSPTMPFLLLAHQNSIFFPGVYILIINRQSITFALIFKKFFEALDICQTSSTFKDCSGYFAS